MRLSFKKSFTVLVCLALLGVLNTNLSAAEELTKSVSYSQINLSEPQKSLPLAISIERSQSVTHHWKPWQKVRVWGYVQRLGGRKEMFKDKDGNSTWDVTLNSLGQASLTLLPSAENFSGRLVIKGNNKTLYASTSYPGESVGYTLEKVYQYRFPDGINIKVFYTDQILEKNGQDEYFPKEVLDAAVSAYQTITQFKGFSTKGYSFASPDKDYAYDPDKTIDIYLGDPSDEGNFSFHCFSALSFKDAPCFDTVRVSETGFHAVILLPANYRDFIKNWERINPSPLGARNLEVDLRGTLIHEMLHVVLFYYNHNLNKEIGDFHDSRGVQNPAHGLPSKKLDWYVEGLARYFETFAGARHDFYSQGFKQVLPDKIRFSRGGSNYFMRYPDQSFMDLRYENALFWRFIDTRYGMASIEQLSREFRGSDPDRFRSTLGKVTGNSFASLLKEFALAILLKDFGLKEDSVFLKEIAKTRLVYRDEQLFLKDGVGSEKALGQVCQTDWVGAWGDQWAKHGDEPVAGDNTDPSDVSGWATDYYEITLAENTDSLPTLSVMADNPDAGLVVQVLLVTRGGSTLKPEEGDLFRLQKEVEKEGLKAHDIEKIFLLVTNADSQETLSYKIRVKP